jgi:hypothetical protein
MCISLLVEAFTGGSFPNIRPGRKADTMSGLADYQITEKHVPRVLSSFLEGT